MMVGDKDGSKRPAAGLQAVHHRLRLAGIEEAHAVAPPGVAEIDITAEQLGAVARRVAVTWTW